MATTVTVVIYTHKHGTGISVFSSSAVAYEQTYTLLVLPFLDDVLRPDQVDEKESIRALGAAGQYADAITAWSEAQLGNGDPDLLDFREDEVVFAAPDPAAPVVAPKCPHCGCTDLDHLALTETFTGYHGIEGVNEHGHVMIVNVLGSTSPSERFDDGASDYAVNCGKCGKTSKPDDAGMGDPENWDWV